VFAILGMASEFLSAFHLQKAQLLMHRVLVTMML